MSHATGGRFPPSMMTGRGRPTPPSRDRIPTPYSMPLENPTTTTTSRQTINTYSSGNGYHFTGSSYLEATEEPYSYRDPTSFARPDESYQDYYEPHEGLRQRVYPDSYPELPPHHQGMHASLYQESSTPYDAFEDNDPYEVESQTVPPPIGMIRFLRRQASTRSSLGSPSNHIRELNEARLNEARGGQSNHSRGGQSNHSRGGLSNHSKGGLSNHSRGGPSNHSRGGQSNHSRGGVGGGPSSNNTHRRVLIRQTSTVSVVSSVHSNVQDRPAPIPDRRRAPRDSIPQSPFPAPEDESDEDRPLIEVAPDLYMYLRGSDETIQAIGEGAIIETICSCCNIVLHCVVHAEFVLCPVCRVVSPLGNFSGVARNGAGVGLGVKTETLMKVLHGM